jgi:hypothetical protein
MAYLYRLALRAAMLIAVSAGSLVTIRVAPVTAGSAYIVHGVALTATEGTAFSGRVANVVTPIVGPQVTTLTAAIFWGDGTTSPGRVTNLNGTYVVRGTHTYADEGGYTTVIAVRDAQGNTGSGKGSASVAEADTFTAPISDPRPATVGVPVTGQIALFTDNGYPANTPADLSATINWGDGSSSAGTVSGGSGSFAVSGTHTYMQSGLVWAVVTLRDRGAGTGVGRTRVPIDVSPAS